jgi:hypothetical protein
MFIMITKIINYLVRSMISLIGVLLLFGLYAPKNADPLIVKVIGFIFILWGIYRIIIYRSRLQEIERDNSVDKNK